MFDVSVLGSGLSAHIVAGYISRKRFSVCLIGHPEESASYRNPCCTEPVAHLLMESGVEYGDSGDTRTLIESIRSGDSITLVEASVTALRYNKAFIVETDGGASMESRSIVISMGKRPSVAELSAIEGIKDYMGGLGVSFNATFDAMFYKGRTVVVYGSGASAQHAVKVLARDAEEVFFVDPQGRDGTGTAEERHRYIPGRRVIRVAGDRVLRSVVLDDGTIIDADALFLERGNMWIDELGYGIGLYTTDGVIYTDGEGATSVEGVYACGEITTYGDSIFESVESGIRAGRGVVRYLERLASEE